MLREETIDNPRKQGSRDNKHHKKPKSSKK